MHSNITLFHSYVKLMSETVTVNKVKTIAIHVLYTLGTRLLVFHSISFM